MEVKPGAGGGGARGGCAGAWLVRVLLIDGEPGEGWWPTRSLGMLETLAPMKACQADFWRQNGLLKTELLNTRDV